MTDEERYGKIDLVRNPEVTCTNCGWVSFALTREAAQAEVDDFNSWFEKQTQETKDMYGGRGSSIGQYRCLRCGGVEFRRARPGDCPDGCTIGPVVWELRPDFMAYLGENGYDPVLPMPGFRWVALTRFMFTTAIIVGDLDDRLGYSDRWCYHTTHDALEALVAWKLAGYDGEPEGWHRHLPSGRRAGPEYETAEALKELDDD